MAARAPLTTAQKEFIDALKLGKGKAKEFLDKLEVENGSGFVIDFLSNGNFFQILRTDRDTSEHRYSEGEKKGQRKPAVLFKLDYYKYLSDLESVCAPYSDEAIRQKHAGLSSVLMIHHLKNVTESHELIKLLGETIEGSSMAGGKAKIKMIQNSQTTSKENLLVMMESADASLISFYFDLLLPKKPVRTEQEFLEHQEYQKRMNIIYPLEKEKIAPVLIGTCTNLALQRAFEIGNVPLILRFVSLKGDQEVVGRLTDAIRKRGELLEKFPKTPKDEAEIKAKFDLITGLTAKLKIKPQYIFAAQEGNQRDLLDHLESIQSEQREQRFHNEVAMNTFLASPEATPKKTALQEAFNSIKKHYDTLLRKQNLEPDARKAIVEEYRQVTAGLLLAKANQIQYDEENRIISRDPARRPSEEDIEELLEHPGLSDVNHKQAIEALDKVVNGKGEEQWLDLSATQFKKFRDALERCKSEQEQPAPEEDHRPEAWMKRTTIARKPRPE